MSDRRKSVTIRKQKIFRDLPESLFGEYGEADPYYILADFPSYIETYEKVYHLYVDHKDEWIKKAIVNTAKSGYFSSDRTIEQYNEKSGI